jgi:hypothetical protein
MRSHCDVIQGRFIGFATEDKSAQPHIQKCPIFDFTKGIVLDVLQDVMLVSVPWLHPCLPRRIFEFPRLNRSCNIKAGDHIHISQGWRHWAVAKEEGVDVV